VIRRYLAGIWSVLRVVPATVICPFGGMICAFAAIYHSVASPFGTLFVIYGAYRGIRRQHNLNRFQPWAPGEVQR
jgi:hypothetical protein